MAIIVVLIGVVAVSGIVIANPRWHTIIASWRDTAALVTGPVGDRADASTASGGALGESPKGAPRRIELQREPDATRAMVNLLVAQLGQDLAWRTALAIAASHAPDSPEFAYWDRAAAAIQDGDTQQ